MWLKQKNKALYGLRCLGTLFSKKSCQAVSGWCKSSHHGPVSTEKKGKIIRRLEGRKKQSEKGRRGRNEKLRK